jgi:hypothetical protein
VTIPSRSRPRSVCRSPGRAAEDGSLRRERHRVEPRAERDALSIIVTGKHNRRDEDVRIPPARERLPGENVAMDRLDRPASLGSGRRDGPSRAGGASWLS